jgi:hypothetical protein
MPPVDAPSWADQLSAWSTFATAILGIATTVAAIAAVVVAVKTYNKQNEVLSNQIKQLEAERDEKLIAQARRVVVRSDVLDDDDQLLPLIALIQRVDAERVGDLERAAYILVKNNSDGPITKVEAEFEGATPRYVWIEGANRLEYYARCRYLASGSSAYFVFVDMSADDVPETYPELTFTNDSGQRWQADRVGKVKRVYTANG